MGIFYIVDQSLKGLGGHHFDYTQLLSVAATKAGWPVVIGCHRRFSSAESLPESEVRNCFRNTTYASCSSLVGIQDMVSRRKNKGLLNWIGNLILGKWHAPGSVNHHQASTDPARLRREQQVRIKTFQEDCHTFFQRPLTREDAVFLTTLSDLEADGLYQFIRERPDAKLANWHLQFHFPIFRGRTPQYKEQIENADYLVRTLRKLKTLSQTNIHLYVTSDTLLDQYSQTGFKFEDLPYPINPVLKSDQAYDPNPPPMIRLAFAGAIRNEKGGDKIQNLIEQFDQPNHSRVCLCVQKKRPKLMSRIRNWFKKEPQSKKVVTFAYPLEADQYQDYIRSADIGLLTTYDSETYFPRRAGIMGEYLTAGVPVIVPAGSWLSDQIEPEQRKYLGQVLNENESSTFRPKTVSTLSTGKTMASFEFREFANGNPFENSSLTILSFNVIKPVGHGNYFRVELLDESGQPIAGKTQITGWPRISSNEKPAGKFQTAFDLNGTTRQPVQFRISPAFGSSQWQLEDIHLIIVDGENSLPRSVIGLIAADPSQTAGLTEEMIEQYSHFRRSAVNFSCDWFDRHDPALTFQSLIDNSDFLKTRSDQAA